MKQDAVAVPAQLDEVTQALQILAGTAGETDDVNALLRAVCDQAVRVVPGADMASITLVRSAEPETAAATDERARIIDLAQYAQGAGPCLEAIRSQTLTRVDLEQAEQLWPEFAESSREHDVASYLAAPLQVDDELNGAVNLFGFQKHGFHDLDERLLALYTQIVTAVLGLSRRSARIGEQVEQLQAAIESRAPIEQAKGILMAAKGITADEAFQQLVEASQRENVKLRTVAARFVESVLNNDLAS